MWKKWLSGFLALVMVLMSVNPVYGAELNTSEEQTEAVADMDDSALKIGATDSFGDLITGEITGKMEEQKENNGCNVFSAEVDGKNVTVDFETTEICSLTAAVYDESGEQMHALGSLENIMPGETQAVVPLETENMPQYFYLRVFLIGADTMKPLCEAYESPMYTREMQEFLAKTVSDFDQERVLNLDADETNNFAVYEEGTLRMEENGADNRVVSADETNRKYVIENAGQDVLSLQAGDVFSYEYDNGEILIVKVADIQIDGTTVTLIGADAEMKDIFEYVKLDEQSYTQDATVDESTCAEGVVYEGMSEDAEGAAYGARSQRDIDISGSRSMELKYSFSDVKLVGGEDNNIKLKGSIGVKFENGIQLYLTNTQKYLEIKFDYKISGSIGVNGKAGGSVPLGTVAFMPVPGIIIEVTPSFIVEFSGSVSLSLTISGKVGYSVSEKGLKSLTSSPKTDATYKMEATVFVGLSLEPEVTILNKYIASASMEAKVGAEIKATRAISVSGLFAELGDAVHTCETCIDGDISAKMELSFSASLLNLKKLTFKYTLAEFTVKVADFYYSVDKNELGWGTCPYMLYKVTVTVKDAKNKAVKDATLDSGFPASDAKGKSEKYLPAGDYILYAEKAGKGRASKSFKVEDAAKAVTVRLGKRNAGSDNAIPVGENTHLIKGGDVWRSWSGWNEVGLIAENGDFYMHYETDDMQGGPGFRKVLEDVREVDLTDVAFGSGGFFSRINGIYKAITNDGTLYTWGESGGGIYELNLGNGMHESRVPVPILSNVKEVKSFGGTNNEGPRRYILALTEDGKLYAWRTGKYDDDEEPEEYTKPFLVAEDVEQIAVDGRTDTQWEMLGAIIFKNGDLYTFGQGNRGDGTEEMYDCEKERVGGFYQLHKVMGNVAQVNLYDKEILTKDGSLYVWGWGGTGHGLEPMKLLDNVAKIYDRDNGSAILKNGDLYIWEKPTNEYQLDPIFSEHTEPHKVLGNVVDYKGFLFEGSNHWEDGVYTALTADGGFYTWGEDYQEHPRDEDGFELYKEPLLVTDNVADVEVDVIGRGYPPTIMLLKEDGGLYMMRFDHEPDYDEVLVPKKVLAGVAAMEKISYKSAFCSVAYTKGGQMFMWHTYGDYYVDGTIELANKYKFGWDPTRIELEAEEEVAETFSMPGMEESARTSGSYTGDGVSRSGTGTTLSGLLPNTPYYFYSMWDRYAQAPLSPDNLLYITQCTTDENGSLTVPYQPSEEEGNPQMFAECMERKDIKDAVVTAADLTYTGAVQETQVSVTREGVLLTEGEDYELEGAYAVRDEGSYSLRVKGIGDYCGEQTVSYQVKKQTGSQGPGGTSQGGSTGKKPTQTQGGGSTAVKTGTVFTSGKFVYVVTGKGKAAVKNPVNKSQKSLKIPATASYKGQTFKVTEIKNNAFASNKKLANVTIGKNVTKIGKKAFYKCAKLKKVTVSTTTLKSVGKNAFKGIAKKATIKVPKKKKAAYKKLLKKGGLANTAKIK